MSVVTGSVKKVGQDRYSHQDETWILVTRYYPRRFRFKGQSFDKTRMDEWLNVVAPTKEMLNKYNEGEIDASILKQLYKDYVKHDPKASKQVKALARRVRNGETIRLFCHELEPPCHRFWLQDMIQQTVTRLEHGEVKGQTRLKWVI